jgi:hypothetical protein
MSRAVENEFSRKEFIKGGGAIEFGFRLAGLEARGAGSATPAASAPLGGPLSTPPTTSID